MVAEIPNKQDVFNRAAEIADGAKRAKYLDEACGGDCEFRAEINDLLRHDALAGSFLESSPAAVAALTVSQPAEQLGTHIGPYKLMEEIGEGGMGTVFMASQTEPVHRKVALKVIKPGMDSKQVVSRFEAERHALAMMDHPSIARVLDGGTTESGRPYFVMELVDGIPITKHCDEQKLNTKERLELFVSACQAVQHAHQKGIIHRDIKPSNLLVTHQDGRAVPKVIDFGIAKATSGNLADQTSVTHFAQMLGTPLYMSPEQAALSSPDIDTRSDIYSLGVLLYELLTGTTPFQSEQMNGISCDEIRRIIREEDPPRPSARVTTIGAKLSTISEQRSVAPRRLAHTLRGELDWIVMKALEKDRDRRYETTNGLAADIRRYLANEPVVACPPSTAYRLRKYVKRNKAFLTMATLVFLALIAGTGVATWQAILADGERSRAQLSEEQAKESERKAKQSEQQARRSEARAERESAIAKAVSDFLQEDLLGKSSPDETPNPEVKLRTILDRAATGIQDKFNDQPLVEAAIRDTIGQAYQALGRYRQAEPHQTRAVALAAEHLGGEDSLTLAYSSRLGNLLTCLGRFQEAEILLRLTFESQHHIVGDEHPDALTSWHRIGSVMGELGQYDEAEKVIRESLDIRRRTMGEEHADTLSSMHFLAILYSAQGRFNEAERLHQQTLEIRKRTLGEEHPDTLHSIAGLAHVYAGQGRYDDAERLWLQTLEIRKRTLGEEHPDTLHSMGALAQVYYGQRRYDEAERLHLQTLEMEKRTLGEEHRHTLCSMNNLALVYYSQGRYDEAEALQLQMLEIAKRTLGEEHPHTLTCMSNLAFVYATQKRYTEAEALFLQTLEVRKRTYGEIHPGSIPSMTRLATIYHDQGRNDEAETVYLQAIEIAKQTLGEEHPTTLATMSTLATLYQRQGRFDEAETLRLDILNIREKLVAQSPGVSGCRFNLAVCYWNLGSLHSDHGKIDESLVACQRATEICEELVAEYPDVVPYRRGLGGFHSGLGGVQLAADDDSQADASFARAIELRSTIPEQDRSVADWGHLAQDLYRVQRYDEAREMLEKTIELRGDEGPTLQLGPRWYYLTMTLAQLGEQETARSHYDQLAKQMKENPPTAPVYERLRAEAAELLGIVEEPEKQDSPQAADNKETSPTENAAEKPEENQEPEEGKQPDEPTEETKDNGSTQTELTN